MDDPQVSFLSMLMCFDGCRPTSIWKRWDGFHQRHGSHLHTHIPVFWSETILALSLFFFFFFNHSFLLVFVFCRLETSPLENLQQWRSSNLSPVSMKPFCSGRCGVKPAVKLTWHILFCSYQCSMKEKLMIVQTDVHELWWMDVWY